MTDEEREGNEAFEALRRRIRADAPDDPPMTPIQKVALWLVFAAFVWALLTVYGAH